jgi:hypothetical protein
LVCLALGVTRGHTAAAAEDAILPLATTPLNQIAGRQVLPWLDAIFEKLLAEKTDIVIDGTAAEGDRITVRHHQEELDRLGVKTPIRMDGSPS